LFSFSIFQRARPRSTRSLTFSFDTSLTAAYFFGRLKPYSVRRYQNSPVQYLVLLKNPAYLRLFYAGFKVFIEAFRFHRIQQSAGNEVAELSAYRMVSLSLPEYFQSSSSDFACLTIPDIPASTSVEKKYP
jgi:hypothetical protein